MMGKIKQNSEDRVFSRDSADVEESCDNSDSILTATPEQRGCKTFPICL
jgi:hypothetical protein